MTRPGALTAQAGDLPIGKQRRPRWTPSEDAKALLETVFAADSFPSFTVRNQLAEQLRIDARQVQIWFQNRRQRERLKTGAQLAAEEKEAADAADADSKPPPWSAPAPGKWEAQADGPEEAGSSSLDTDAATDPHIQDAVGITRLADAGLHARNGVGPAAPDFNPGPALSNMQSPSAGSDETSRTSLVGGQAFSLQTSPTLAPLNGLNGLSGLASCAPVSQLPEAALAGRRTLDLPGGGTVELPTGAPPALRQMFDTPGGSRALQLAARSLLRNNPILQHPGAPCHSLLNKLANMPSDAGGPGGDACGAEQFAALTAPLAYDGPLRGGAGLARAPLAAVSERGRASSEALEVLSSQFFSGAQPSRRADSPCKAEAEIKAEDLP